MTQPPYTSKAELALSNIRWQGTPIAGFASAARAVWQIVSHMLCEPECFAWKLILPPAGPPMDLADAQWRLRLVDNGIRDGWATFQSIYDAYIAAGQRAADDADRLGWFGEAHLAITVFGLDGVIVGASAQPMRVTTIYIAGSGDPRITVARQKSASADIDDREEMPDRQLLRRLVGTRHERPKRHRERWEPHEGSRHEQKWSDAQRLYYRVFRPAFRAVKRLAARGGDPDAPWYSESLKALGRRLPHGAPTIECWLNARRNRP